MCGMLDHYRRAFSQLRMEKDRRAWTELTKRRPPGKPFLLMSVLDLIVLLFNLTRYQVNYPDMPDPDTISFFTDGVLNEIKGDGGNRT